MKNTHRVTFFREALGIPSTVFITRHVDGLLDEFSVFSENMMKLFVQTRAPLELLPKQTNLLNHF
jgi:hypothetical protein